MRNKTCTCCAGTGQLHNFTVHDGEYIDTIQCSVCEGTGLVIAEEDSVNKDIVITFGPNQKFFDHLEELNLDG